MAGTINFFTEDISFRLKNKRGIRSWIAAVIVKSKADFKNLNFIFCSDQFLLEMNRDFLKHDYLTDIITFSDGTLANINGEIYISIDRVKENAQQFKTSFETELHRVMIHGVLHMLGYKDKQKTDKRKMRSMENKVLSLRTF